MSAYAVSYMLFLNLYTVPPKIRSTEVQYTVVENSRVVLSCIADGIPVPSMSWKKDGVLLMDTVGRHTTQPFGGLIVDSAVVRINISNMLKMDGMKERVWSLLVNHEC